MAREFDPENNTEERWAVMSNRFLKWAQAWIEDKIPPGANHDLESHDTRAKRLMDQLYAEAAAANFSKDETKEERERIAPLVMSAVSDATDFDYDAFTLKYLLAREFEDGD